MSRNCAFITTVFDMWKNATKACEKHQKSACHQEAVVKWHHHIKHTNISSQLDKQVSCHRRMNRGGTGGTCPRNRVGLLVPRLLKRSFHVKMSDSASDSEPDGDPDPTPPPSPNRLKQSVLNFSPVSTNSTTVLNTSSSSASAVETTASLSSDPGRASTSRSMFLYLLHGF